MTYIIVGPNELHSVPFVDQTIAQVYGYVVGFIEDPYGRIPVYQTEKSLSIQNLSFNFISQILERSNVAQCARAENDNSVPSERPALFSLDKPAPVLQQAVLEPPHVSILPQIADISLQYSYHQSIEPQGSSENGFLLSGTDSENNTVLVTENPMDYVQSVQVQAVNVVSVDLTQEIRRFSEQCAAEVAGMAEIQSPSELKSGLSSSAVPSVNMLSSAPKSDSARRNSQKTATITEKENKALQRGQNAALQQQPRQPDRKTTPINQRELLLAKIQQKGEICLELPKNALNSPIKSPVRAGIKFSTTERGRQRDAIQFAKSSRRTGQNSCNIVLLGQKPPRRRAELRFGQAMGPPGDRCVIRFKSGL